MKIFLQSILNNVFCTQSFSDSKQNDNFCILSINEGCINLVENQNTNLFEFVTKEIEYFEFILGKYKILKEHGQTKKSDIGSHHSEIKTMSKKIQQELSLNEQILSTKQTENKQLQNLLKTNPHQGKTKESSNLNIDTKIA